MASMPQRGLLNTELSTEALWDIEDVEESSELLGPREAREAFCHAGLRRRFTVSLGRLGGLLSGAALAGVLVICLLRQGGGLGFSGTRDVGAKVGLSSEYSGLGSFLGIERPERANLTDAPEENLHDGNVCSDDEELFEELCYKQCRLLTDGEYPERTSSWSCWKGGASSKIFDEKVGSKIPYPCKDYDVAGDSMGNGCPHSPGACLEDEEIYLDVCYKKCSLLTNGAYPYRVAISTCCKEKGFGCLGFWNSMTDQDFSVGGGKGDGDKSTPSGMHSPLKELTEEATA
uniref:Uncharacterized protein n=1 Tax=Alexandrium catenella TaxID=2925 RepID=A0A7S1PW66_ALECA